MSIQMNNDLPDDRSSLPGRSIVAASMAICGCTTSSPWEPAPT
jgi:hypothetical protein